MAGFRPDAFLISIIIFSFIIAVGGGWIVSMADHYDVEYDDEFGDIYKPIKEIENLTKSQKGSVIGGEIEETDALDSAIKGATSAVKLMTSPIRLVTLIAEDVESEVPGGLPEEIDLGLYIKVALTIMVIFALIYLFFRIRSW